MILKLSRSVGLSVHFGFHSVGRVVNLNYIGSLRAITVHGSAGHRPFTAFISGARLFVLFNVFAVKSDG